MRVCVCVEFVRELFVICTTFGVVIDAMTLDSVYARERSFILTNTDTKIYKVPRA